ncbi:protease, insulinase family/protease, insulinase family [Labilithrix luteola]|uniref:Protease, insulinase family/protease, insulinase family n=1 Tax=Labilithrix luteola TaxID=1391654 RepID=A0A0K1Q9K1_9BACT|nr:pitrilysin family protein [Labilithrix luteola]AKV02095.1 protease, insulinase family/protease, insulinase family [Labilithrix luteola]
MAIRSTALAFGLAALLSAPAARADVSIPFTRSTLPNGMTVIFQEDHSIPIVVVNVSYDVGSRFEAKGRTGFAHLFEHLMFMGTRRAPTKAFDAWMEASGGWNNAWTSQDRTDYYDVGAPTSLDLLLWLEADRLRDLGPLMTKEKLDAQRDVVRNERRQTSENTPYGKVELRLPELLYPNEHPYHHPVIGSHEDLEAATVDDVKGFFAQHYDPANASLVVAGDFDPRAAKDKIDRWFGTIPSRGKAVDPGAPGFSDTKTTLTSVVRETLEDEVELPKIVMAWQSPKHFAPGDAELDLLGAALSNGKASRLYKALVYDQKLAQSVDAGQDSGSLGSRFEIGVIARPGVSLEKLEAAIDKELEAIRRKPIADEELERSKNLVETAFVMRLEGVRERASLLNMYQAEVKDPGFVQKDLDRYRSATKEGIQKAAEAYLLPNARVVLRVVPKKKGNSK